MSIIKMLPLAVIIGAGALGGCQTKSVANNTSNIEHSTDSKKSITIKDLAKYNWELESAVDNNNKKLTDLLRLKDEASLTFTQSSNPPMVNFNVGCNSMGGQANLKSNILSISQVMSTQMMCDKPTNVAEHLLAKSMQGTSQLMFEGGDEPLLTQVTSNGFSLVWKGVMTPETKYDVKPDIVFIQIAPETQACPGDSTQVCLKVRQIHYNDKGIKTGTGDWKLFHEKIEGYTHNKNLDQIVRLKHYIVNPMDVKGKKSVYVLDTVVESGVVN